MPVSIWLAGLFFCCHLAASAAVYPPLSTEISPSHPLFIFSITVDTEAPPEALQANIQQTWDRIPETIQPYSALRFDAGEGSPSVRAARYRQAMETLQPLGIPMVLTLQPGPADRRMLPGALEELLSAYTNVRGIDVTGATFDTYPLPEAGPEAAGRSSLWLADIVHTAAQYGRYTHVAMEGLQWARAMSNITAAPFYHKLRECSGYVIPAAWQRGSETVAAQSAAMGLWLEGAAGFWGIAADGRWYGDGPFLSPGTYGRSEDPVRMPGAFYRGMMLNGVMAGANVFSFGPATGIWGDPATSPLEQHIFPLIQRILNLALIPDAARVREHTPLAYQLSPSATPPDFQLILRDWSSVHDEGLLLRAAVAPVQAGAVPELIPNRSGPFWIPMLSAHASEEARAGFGRVADPGTVQTVEGWTEILNTQFGVTERGGPFVNAVGRGLFVLNTFENTLDTEPFEIAALPAPVRGITATRTDAGVVLNWPFREGDVSFSVYRKVPPEEQFVRIAQGLLERTYTDAEAPGLMPVTYSVTALTNEEEPFNGLVSFGDFLAWSTVESRIEEAVTLSPVLAEAKSAALPPRPEAVSSPASTVAEPTDAPPLPEGAEPVREAILKSLAGLRLAFEAKDLDGLMAFYSEGYEDPEGWGDQYAQRAFQWLFERYRAHRMLYQVREWDFSAFESAGTVNVRMFVELRASALTDSSGALANPQVVLPRTPTRELWTTWVRESDTWRLIFTNPALPNFRELLSYLSGPYDHYPVGPDLYTGPR